MPTSVLHRQESGRAGRDGKPGSCILLYTKTDRRNREQALFYQEIAPSLRRSLMRCQASFFYCCNRHECRRAQLLQYLGEEPLTHAAFEQMCCSQQLPARGTPGFCCLEPDGRPRCGRCDNCEVAESQRHPAAVQSCKVQLENVGEELRQLCSTQAFLHTIAKHRLGDALRSTVNAFTSASGESKFLESGTLTPEEFVEAGDQLTFKFPTWRWEAGDANLRASYLPQEQQYLITRSQLDVDDLASPKEGKAEVGPVLNFNADDDFLGDGAKASNLPDFSDLDKQLQEEDGYPAASAPAAPASDVLSDYKSRTVTVDPHPLTGTPTVSIHPCQHAQVMKKVIDDWIEQGLTPRHDLALFVFLKFISSVVPTINYDFTMEIEF
eukprot:g12887.t1